MTFCAQLNSISCENAGISSVVCIFAFWLTCCSSCYLITQNTLFCVCVMNHMMTSSNENIFRVTGHLCGEFTGPGEFPAQRPVTRTFDVFFDLCLNKRLSKKSLGWWFETLSHPLWRHCNELTTSAAIVLLFLSIICLCLNIMGRL